MKLIKEWLGNIEILNLHKTAFLCSRKVPAGAVLTCYDWAIAQREAGTCVIGGFHSQLEKDVLHYLLKGTQPIIIALARGLKQTVEPELQKALENGRLLIITSFKDDIKRVTKETSFIRNELMINVADEIVVGFASENGRLMKLLTECNPEKKITHLHKTE